MFFFKDQFAQNFMKEDSSMGSGGKEDDIESEKDILAGESQNPDDEDFNEDDVELSRFWNSVNEDRRRRSRAKP